MQSISDITFQDAVNAFVLQYRGERLKKIFGSLRLDNDWITINGTHVLVDKDGNALSGGKLVGKNFKDAKSQKKVSVKRTEAQSKTLGKIIKKTANLKKEQYRIIDKDGNVLLEKKGDKSSVASTVGEHRENLPGNISIHNHPEGGTFSTADLSDFGYGAQEIVVASPEGTYSLVNTRMGQPDQFDGWIPLRDAIEKDIPEQSPFDNLKKARENLKDSPEMKQMKSIEGEWLE